VTAAGRRLLVRGFMAGALACPPRPLAPMDRVKVRDVADGSGPSHLIPLGEYLLVVDPWAAAIRRYSLADLHAAPVTCTYARAFAPWRTVRTANGVRLIAEPYGPDKRGNGYHFRSRQAMTLTLAAVRRMADGAACGFPIGRYHSKSDTPPPIAWSHGERPGSTARFGLRGGGSARIAPQGGSGAEVYAIREAGSLAGGRTLVWWSEVDPAEQPDAPPGGPGLGGRVTASQYVGVVAKGGGTPLRVVRLRTAAYPRLAAGQPMPPLAMLTKPGFEYVAGAAIAGRDALLILAADMDARGPRPFVIRRYDLGTLGRGGQAVVPLMHGGEPAADRNDPAGDEHPQGSRPRPRLVSAQPRGPWFAETRQLLRTQIAFRWRFPAGAGTRPCGGADKCAVGSNQFGALGTGPAYPYPVVDKVNRTGGAQWMRPRHLVGLAPGTEVRGIPYSIGGTDLASDFAARLAAGYAPGATNGPPVGHIREGLEWPGHAGNYPLGIDCSALIARVSDLEIRSTGGMMRPQMISTTAGSFGVPRGPARACPQPVRHLSELKPGDIFLREGHVVIYAGTARLGGAPHRPRALRVFEAGSRCGAVCESVYDPTYFDGWWMLRFRVGDASDCPQWLGAAAGGERLPEDPDIRQQNIE